MVTTGESGKVILTLDRLAPLAGLLSAAAEYGSSHQASQFVQVVTDRPMRVLVVEDGESVYEAFPADRLELALRLKPAQKAQFDIAVAATQRGVFGFLT